MRKSIIAILSAIPLLGGFFPPTVYSTITSVNGDEATISKAFPVDGMSGIVIHKFGNTNEAISSIAVQTSANRIKLIKDDMLGDNKLPKPKISASIGDKVIAGYLYNNVLVIAPNAQTYQKIVSSAPKHWIHPDIYAGFLAREGESTPNLNNLSKFARESQVGLIYVVLKDKAILIDPLSKRVINTKPFTPIGDDTKYPFYMRFKKFRAGLFSSSSGNYYQLVEGIR